MPFCSRATKSTKVTFSPKNKQHLLPSFDGCYRIRAQGMMQVSGDIEALHVRIRELT